MENEVNQLKKHRLNARMTQSEIAAKIGVKQPTYQRWEAGNHKIPEEKLRKISTLLSVPADVLLGTHAPIKLERYFDGSPQENQYYGEVAFHFSGGGEPLLLSISEKELHSLYRDMQGDSFYIVTDSLSNQKVAIRRSSLADTYFSSHVHDDFGPEHGTYKEPPILLPDPRDWEILESLEYESADIDELSVKRVMELVAVPSAEEIEERVRLGFVSAAGAEEYARNLHNKSEMAFKLATEGTYQLSSGKIRSFKADRDLALHDSLYEIFDNFSDVNASAHLLLKQEDGYDRSIFVNPNSMDYICVPAHIWNDLALTVSDQIMGEG